MSRSGKGALKHGLYARRLTQDEIELIGPVPILNIDGEIAYQRAVINRLGQILENNGLAAESTEALTVETRSTVKLLNEALGRLLTYLRLHHMLKGDLTEFREEIEAGKMIGRRRRHVFDYFKPPTHVPDEGEAEAPRDASRPTRERKKRAGAEAKRQR